MDDPEDRTADVDAETEQALGTLGKALETVEHARGHLYAFHRLSGTADLTLGQAVDQLRAAGYTGLAARVEAELLGRNVLPGRWSYQIVEEYDDGYWGRFRDVERQARDELAGGRRHAFEARMKRHRADHDRPGFELAP